MYACADSDNLLICAARALKQCLPTSSGNVQDVEKLGISYEVCTPVYVPTSDIHFRGAEKQDFRVAAKFEDPSCLGIIFAPRCMEHAYNSL